MSKSRATRIAAQLAPASKKVLVNFTRPFESGSVSGYVLANGPEFFLLALVHPLIRFDGFQCFRYRDVRHLQSPERHADFIETALRKRNEVLPKKPRVDLATLAKLLTTASRAFPLVTIHLEKDDAGVCYIGRVVEVTDKHVSLLEISPGASWDRAPSEYRLKDITRVDFGGSYEEALHLVGGDPPAIGEPA
jgi:hypothetical protein